MTDAVSMTNLTKHYGGVQALTDLTLDIPAGTRFRLPRPEWRRQNDRDEGARRPRPSDERHGHDQRVSRVGIRGPSSRARVPRAGPAVLRLDDRPRDASIRRALPRIGPWPRCMDQRVASTGSASPTPPTAAPSTYSGGMRQRLGIAQALVGRPAVILLDEPVSALDPIGRKDVLELMQALKGETTVFYSTHILDDVQRVSDHVAILDHGRLVTAAPTQELLGSFTKNMLRVVLGGASDAHRESLPRLPGVATVIAVSHDGEAWTYDVTTSMAHRQMCNARSPASPSTPA